MEESKATQSSNCEKQHSEDEDSHTEVVQTLSGQLTDLKLQSEPYLDRRGLTHNLPPSGDFPSLASDDPGGRTVAEVPRRSPSPDRRICHPTSSHSEHPRRSPDGDGGDGDNRPRVLRSGGGSVSFSGGATFNIDRQGVTGAEPTFGAQIGGDFVQVIGETQNQRRTGNSRRRDDTDLLRRSPNSRGNVSFTGGATFNIQRGGVTADQPAFGNQIGGDFIQHHGQSRLGVADARHRDSDVVRRQSPEQRGNVYFSSGPTFNIQPGGVSGSQPAFGAQIGGDLIQHSGGQ